MYKGGGGRRPPEQSQVFTLFLPGRFVAPRFVSGPRFVLPSPIRFTFPYSFSLYFHLDSDVICCPPASSAFSHPFAMSQWDPEIPKSNPRESKVLSRRRPPKAAGEKSTQGNQKYYKDEGLSKVMSNRESKVGIKSLRLPTISFFKIQTWNIFFNSCAASGAWFS
jgi:hypothetical protein